MSKKNNKATKRRLHAHDLAKEKQEQEKRQKLLEKKKEVEQVSGRVKKKASKPMRIRKGVRVKGIKITDSESKRKAKLLLQREAAMKMDLDGAMTKSKKKGTKQPTLKGIKGIKAKKEKKPKAGAAGGDTMQE